MHANLFEILVPKPVVIVSLNLCLAFICHARTAATPPSPRGEVLSQGGGDEYLTIKLNSENPNKTNSHNNTLLSCFKANASRFRHDFFVVRFRHAW